MRNNNPYIDPSLFNKPPPTFNNTSPRWDSFKVPAVPALTSVSNNNSSKYATSSGAISNRYSNTSPPPPTIRNYRDGSPPSYSRNFDLPSSSFNRSKMDFLNESPSNYRRNSELEINFNRSKMDFSNELPPNYARNSELPSTSFNRSKLSTDSPSNYSRNSELPTTSFNRSNLSNDSPSNYSRNSELPSTFFNRSNGTASNYAQNSESFSSRSKRDFAQNSVNSVQQFKPDVLPPPPVKQLAQSSVNVNSTHASYIRNPPPHYDGGKVSSLYFGMLHRYFDGMTQSFFPQSPSPSNSYAVPPPSIQYSSPQPPLPMAPPPQNPPPPPLPPINPIMALTPLIPLSSMTPSGLSSGSSSVPMQNNHMNSQNFQIRMPQMSGYKGFKRKYEVNDRLPRKRKKPISKVMPHKRDWTIEEARRALDVERESNKKLRRQGLIIKFPDLELNRDIISSFHTAIESVHFQHPSTPRYCFVKLSESADPESVINQLNQIPFGLGYLSAEFKKVREEDPNMKPTDIDPLTLYVGNLAREVTKDDVITAYPKSKRIDIGYAKKMKYTRYAFVSFYNADDAMEAYVSTHSSQMHSKSLIVRFRRLHGTVGLPQRTKSDSPEPVPESIVTIESPKELMDTPDPFNIDTSQWENHSPDMREPSDEDDYDDFPEEPIKDTSPTKFRPRPLASPHTDASPPFPLHRPKVIKIKGEKSFEEEDEFFDEERDEFDEYDSNSIQLESDDQSQESPSILEKQDEIEINEEPIKRENLPLNNVKQELRLTDTPSYRCVSASRSSTPQPNKKDNINRSSTPASNSGASTPQPNKENDIKQEYLRSTSTPSYRCVSGPRSSTPASDSEHSTPQPNKANGIKQEYLRSTNTPSYRCVSGSRYSTPASGSGCSTPASDSGRSTPQPNKSNDIKQEYLRSTNTPSYRCVSGSRSSTPATNSTSSTPATNSTSTPQPNTENDMKQEHIRSTNTPSYRCVSSSRYSTPASNSSSSTPASNSIISTPEPNSENRNPAIVSIKLENVDDPSRSTASMDKPRNECENESLTNNFDNQDQENSTRESCNGDQSDSQSYNAGGTNSIATRVDEQHGNVDSSKDNANGSEERQLERTEEQSMLDNIESTIRDIKTECADEDDNMDDGDVESSEDDLNLENLLRRRSKNRKR